MQPAYLPDTSNFPKIRVKHLEADVAAWPEFHRITWTQRVRADDAVAELEAEEIETVAAVTTEIRAVTEKATVAAVEALVTTHPRVVAVRQRLRAAQARQREAMAVVETSKAVGRSLTLLVQLRTSPGAPPQALLGDGGAMVGSGEDADAPDA